MTAMPACLCMDRTFTGRSTVNLYKCIRRYSMDKLFRSAIVTYSFAVSSVFSRFSIWSDAGARTARFCARSTPHVAHSHEMILNRHFSADPLDEFARRGSVLGSLVLSYNSNKLRRCVLLMRTN